MEKTKIEEKKVTVQPKEETKEEQEIEVASIKPIKASDVKDWEKLPAGSVVVDEAKQV